MSNDIKDRLLGADYPGHEMAEIGFLALDHIEALEAQLAAVREALRGCKLHLADAQSGFIPGSGTDEAWDVKRDELVAEAETALGKDTK